MAPLEFPSGCFSSYGIVDAISDWTRMCLATLGRHFSTTSLSNLAYTRFKSSVLPHCLDKSVSQAMGDESPLGGVRKLMNI